jgi:AcrR family transcriptional regulator
LVSPLLAERPSRRTQAERSAATRALLMDAALDCLVDLGYAGTTTTVVAERAGVSRGAQLHHFPIRATLVAAAVQHLFAGLTEEYQKGFAGLPPSVDRVRAAIDLLWSMYTEPRYAAVLELYTAARTDAELHARIRPIADRHQRNVFRLARAYFPELRPAVLDATLALILDTMQGMAVSRFLFGDGTEEARRLDSLYEIAARALGPVAGRTREAR